MTIFGAGALSRCGRHDVCRRLEPNLGSPVITLHTARLGRHEMHRSGVRSQGLLQTGLVGRANCFQEMMLSRKARVAVSIRRKIALQRLR
eukprot:6176340-Pleurochrysis_carterae.AAC.2